MRLRPDGEGQRFLTLPPGHDFEGWRGEFGVTRDILMASRRYIAGEIDQATTESLIARLLADWSKIYEDAS